MTEEELTNYQNFMRQMNQISEYGQYGQIMVKPCVTVNVPSYPQHHPFQDAPVPAQLNTEDNEIKSGQLFEGDMILTPDQMKSVLE